MRRQRVMLLGATGETGRSILDGLLECESFEVEALIRPSSAEKPEVKQIAKKGVKICIADLGGSIDDLASLLSGVHVCISAIGPGSQLKEMTLATAAKRAGVERFVPCAFTTVAPVGDVMLLRDEKEEVYNHVKRLFLPFTVIDVGYWYQISFPRLPSGRVNYAALTGSPTIIGGGKAPNLLTDLRDIGRFVARIIADDRTLNKYVYAWGDILSQNQVFDMLEQLSNEKIERQYVTAQEIDENLANIKSLYANDSEDQKHRFMMYITQYSYSKYIRQDNQPKYAQYLGYLDARELYPDFKPRSFHDFLVELLDGKIAKPYPNRTLG